MNLTKSKRSLVVAFIIFFASIILSLKYGYIPDAGGFLVGLFVSLIVGMIWTAIFFDRNKVWPTVIIVTSIFLFLITSFGFIRLAPIREW